MSKYKVGDKVLVEGVLKRIDENCDYPYQVRIADVHKIYFFEDEIKDASKTYEDGLNDAWELARKIENKLDIPTAREIFDAYRIADILDNFTPQEALAKIEAYEKSKQIQVGDVIYADDEPDSFGVVTWKYNNGVYVMWDDGSCGDETNIEELHKTGRHIDISNLLEQIRGDE